MGMFSAEKEEEDQIGRWVCTFKFISLFEVQIYIYLSE